MTPKPPKLTYQGPRVCYRGQGDVVYVVGDVHTLRGAHDCFLRHPTVRCRREKKIDPAAVIKFSDSVDSHDKGRLSAKTEMLASCPNFGEVGESGCCHGDTDLALGRNWIFELAVYGSLAVFENDCCLHLRSLLVRLA
jgi:hypothetical protein